MIYSGRKAITEIYIGDRPVSSVYLGDCLIWCSRVYAQAGAVIVLTSDALLRTAPGVTYTAEVEGGAISRVTAKAAPGVDTAGRPVLAIQAVAAPYMRHIAPMKTASLSASITSAEPSSSAVESGKTAAIAGAEQAAQMTAGQGGEAMTPAQTAAGIQRSTPLVGQGGITGQMHSGGGVQRSDTLAADGNLHDAGATGGGGYRIGTSSASGDRHAALADAMAVQKTKPMYGGADRFAACNPVNPLQGSFAPAYAGIGLEACPSCGNMVTATPAARGSYAGIRQSKAVNHTQAFHVAAEPALATGTQKGVSRIAVAVCAACMTVRIGFGAFDETPVTDLDILALAEIDQMAICE